MPMFTRILSAVVALIAAVNWTPVHAAQWNEAVRYNFVPTGSGAGSDKGYYPPLGVLVHGTDVYGSTYYGGGKGGGTIYRAVGTAVTVLYSFKDQNMAGCGYNPSAVLVIKNGALIGTTLFGGVGGGGVIYKLTSNPNHPNGEWTCKVLVSFANSGPDSLKGYGPFGGLLLASDGSFYGTTQSGGAGKGGVLFKLTQSGNTWTYTPLFKFWTTGTNANNGFMPAGRVITDGTALYGMTYFGGIRSKGRSGGVIYKFTLGNPGIYEVLYKFPGASTDGTALTDKGYQPTINGLLRDPSGLLYGETTLGGNPKKAGTPAGVVFKFDPTSSTYTVLHTFDSSTNVALGYSPFGGLNTTAGGKLIGTAQLGGVNGGGVVFTLSTTGTGYQDVFDFVTDTTTGYKPGGPLVPDSTGAFVGTTYYGGTQNGGVLYQVKP